MSDFISSIANLCAYAGVGLTRHTTRAPTKRSMAVRREGRPLAPHRRQGGRVAYNRRRQATRPPCADTHGYVLRSQLIVNLSTANGPDPPATRAARHAKYKR